jgi:hypothetical protein
MIEHVRREPPCLSDLKLDQLLSGELTGERERAACDHLLVCLHCERRRVELAADRALFADSAPNFDRLTETGKKVRRLPRAWAGGRRAPLMAAAFALSAALVALGVGLGRLGLDPGALEGEAPAGEAPRGTRTKGASPVLGFIVRRGQESFWGEPGQELAPGDELRFTVSAKRPLYCGVWGVDALGRTSAYHGSAELAQVEAGARQPLPGAAVLDGSLGEEHLVAVFCSRRVAAAELLTAIAAAPDAPSLPEDCSYELLTIVKALP